MLPVERRRQPAPRPARQPLRRAPPRCNVSVMATFLGFDIGTPRLPVVEPGDAVGEKVMAEVRKHALDVPVTV